MASAFQAAARACPLRPSQNRETTPARASLRETSITASRSCAATDTTALSTKTRPFRPLGRLREARASFLPLRPTLRLQQRRGVHAQRQPFRKLETGRPTETDLHITGLLRVQGHPGRTRPWSITRMATTAATTTQLAFLRSAEWDVVPLQTDPFHRVRFESLGVQPPH